MRGGQCSALSRVAEGLATPLTCCPSGRPGHAPRGGARLRPSHPCCRALHACDSLRRCSDLRAAPGAAETAASASPRGSGSHTRCENARVLCGRRMGCSQSPCRRSVPKLGINQDAAAAPKLDPQAEARNSLT